MKIAGNSFEEFHDAARRKKIIAFGASDFLRVISLNYKDLRLDHYIESVADNDAGKQGWHIMVNGSMKPIISPDSLREYDEDSFTVLISSDVYAYEIYKQLEGMLGEKDVDIFVLPLMISAHVDDATENHMPEGHDEKDKIPRTIHYSWFSGEKKDELSLRCIESWKRACPDYELKEWNSSNYDVTVNPFAHEAYKQGKWAYVSDYARLDTVYRYGGIYLDLDVFLYKNLDVLLKNDFFVGFGPIRDIEAAIFGAVKGCPAVKEMMDIYRDREFDMDISMRLPNLQPVLLDRFFEGKGFEINGKYQKKDGMAIYPRDLFSAKNWFTGEYEVNDAALGVHECAGGWAEKNGKGSKQIRAEGIRKLDGLYKAQKMDGSAYKGDARKMMANIEEQYQLSICIPNYNRPEMLERLLEEVAGQIAGNGLEQEVEICVSDDCSEMDPLDIIKEIKSRFPSLTIVYARNEKNMGMDYNFLNCVRVAHGKFAWIVGNDDVPAEGALCKILEMLGRSRYQDIDIIVTPFDSFDYDGNFVGTVHPLGSDMKEDRLFDTAHKDQLHQLIMAASDNSALFGFLSNVVFKRERWIQHGDMFADRMSSIFIQVYMNLQTLMDGARYLYTPQKIIRNYLDEETNQTVDRTYRIAAGLYDAMDFFLTGEERAYIEKQVMDIFMASVFMEFPETDARKRKVDSFISEKMDMLREYYIKKDARAEYFRDRPVIIYGAGRFGRMALEDLEQYDINVIGFCDADVSKQGGSIKGKLIFGFERLIDEYFQHGNCTIVVANNRHLVPIIQNLLRHQILRIAVIT